MKKIILFLMLILFLSSMPQALAYGEYSRQPNQKLSVNLFKKFMNIFRVFSLAPPGSTEEYMFEVKSDRCFSSDYYPITVRCDCDGINAYCSEDRYYCKVAIGAGSGDCTYASSYEQVVELTPRTSYSIYYIHTMACGQCWQLEYYGYSEAADVCTANGKEKCSSDQLGFKKCDSDSLMECQNYASGGLFGQCWIRKEVCQYGCKGSYPSTYCDQGDVCRVSGLEVCQVNQLGFKKCSGNTLIECQNYATGGLYGHCWIAKEVCEHGCEGDAPYSKCISPNVCAVNSKEECNINQLGFKKCEGNDLIECQNYASGGLYGHCWINTGRCQYGCEGVYPNSKCTAQDSCTANNYDKCQVSQLGSKKCSGNNLVECQNYASGGLYGHCWLVEDACQFGCTQTISDSYCNLPPPPPSIGWIWIIGGAVVIIIAAVIIYSAYKKYR